MNLPSLALFLTLANVALADTPAPAKLTEQESKFQTAMANVVFEGRWFPHENGALGESKDDSYSILGIEKQPDGRWKVRAKMKYGSKEFEVPVPVKVEWAGDTPVLVVENLLMPGGQVKYSARVLVHDGAYAGTWSGGGQAGLLAGLVVKK
jgi:hypothetical protein